MIKQLLVAVGASALVAGLLVSLDAAQVGASANPGRNGKIAYVQPASGGFGSYIASVNPDGTGITTLTSGPYDLDPAWSPDGTKIAFVSNRGDTVYGDYDVYVMNADGSNVTRLTSYNDFVSGPTWSPDGSKIAFARVDDQTLTTDDIWVMNADGSGATDVTNSPLATDAGPSWSPDGSKIAFESGPSEPNLNIFTMNPDGSGVTQLTNSPTSDWNPDWSPDGSKIAFQAFGTSDLNPFSWHVIHVMNADGTGEVNLMPHPQTQHVDPAWSPDGTKIAYTNWSNDTGGRIETINTDGSGVALVLASTDFLAADAEVAWQPLPGFNFTGFSGSVQNPPAINSAKAGAAVQVKFSLGGDKGLGVLAASSPRSYPIDCTTAASLGSAVPTAGTGGGLSFDATSGQYQYGWKTDKAWAGTCRALDVALTDGSHHLAYLKFR